MMTYAHDKERKVNMKRNEETNQKEFIQNILNNPQFLAYILQYFIFELKEIPRIEIPKYIKEISDLYVKDMPTLHDEPIGNAYVKEQLQSKGVLLELSFPNIDETAYCACYVETNQRDDWQDDPLSISMNLFNSIYYNQRKDAKKKVYIVSICMDHDMDAQHSIIFYSLKPEGVGLFEPSPSDQSPMNIYVVFPNENSQNEQVNHLMKLLLYTFSNRLVIEDKLYLLKKRYHISTE